VQMTHHYKGRALVPSYVDQLGFYLSVVPEALGWSGTLLLVAGLVVARREWRAWAPLVALPITTLLVFASAEIHFERFLVPPPPPSSRAAGSPPSPSAGRGPRRPSPSWPLRLRSPRAPNTSVRRPGRTRWTRRSTPSRPAFPPGRASSPASPASASTGNGSR